MGYFPVWYNSRVVIYKHKMFIRLATDVDWGTRKKKERNRKMDNEINILRW